MDIKFHTPTEVIEFAAGVVLPRIGEEVILNEVCYVVENVIHDVRGGHGMRNVTVVLKVRENEKVRGEKGSGVQPASRSRVVGRGRR